MTSDRIVHSYCGLSTEAKKRSIFCTLFFTYHGGEEGEKTTTTKKAPRWWSRWSIPRRALRRTAVVLHHVSRHHHFWARITTCKRNEKNTARTGRLASGRRDNVNGLLRRWRDDACVLHRRRGGQGARAFLHFLGAACILLVVRFQTARLDATAAEPAKGKQTAQTVVRRTRIFRTEETTPALRTHCVVTAKFQISGGKLTACYLSRLRVACKRQNEHARSERVTR